MRLGIVGCGLIGAKRAASALRLGHAVAVVADRDQARAQALAAETGAAVVADAEAVARADVEAVVVATSHDALSESARLAVAAGHDVLVEKPAGRTLAEIMALQDAARTNGRVVKVGFNHRFHPALMKARELVDDGIAGPLLYIRGRYGHGGRPGMDDEWRCRPEISGGGELIDQGAHLVDLSRWFLGDLTLDYAHLPRLFWNAPVEDNAFLALTADSGAVAWLHASWVEWKNTFAFEIVGRAAKLEISGLGGSYGVERLTLYRMRPEMGPPETTSWEYPVPDTSWDRELLEFEAALRAGRRPSGDIEDACAVMRIVEAAYGRGTP
jgi:predicted dehydrogenase